MLYVSIVRKSFKSVLESLPKTMTKNVCQRPFFHDYHDDERAQMSLNTNCGYSNMQY